MRLIVRQAVEGGVELVSEVQDYNDIRIMGAIEDRLMLSTSNIPQMYAVLIMTFVLPNTSETSSVGGFGHIGGAVHPIGNRHPGIFGYRLDEIVQAFVLADGDGEADVHPAADGDHGVGIEAAVGPHRELPAGPAVANPAHRLTQEVGGAGQKRVITPARRCSRGGGRPPWPVASARPGGGWTRTAPLPPRGGPSTWEPAQWERKMPRWRDGPLPSPLWTG